MTLDDFEAISDEAFSYLVSDFGYSAESPEVSGRFGTGFGRRYSKGNLAIYFLYGDVDSTHLCSITFADGLPERVKRRHMARALSVLLSDRYPEYAHKTTRHITSEDSAKEIIFEYAKLLREFGEDAINGDFSGFPVLVYLLMYFDGNEGRTQDVGRPVGVFSSLKNAETALAIRHRRWANHESIDGYMIMSVDVDSKDLLTLYDCEID